MNKCYDLKKGDLVKSPSGNIGIIKIVQKKERQFAEGYFVYFDDIKMRLFMAEDCLEKIESKPNCYFIFY